MFDQLRDSLRGLSDRLAPEERRRVTSSMRDALVHAKLALGELRDAARATEARVATERAELETVRRRQGLAAQINDAETVAIAERFAAQHAERVAVLEAKLQVQQQELSMVEREYDEMTTQLRMAMSGLAPGGASPEVAAQREVDALLADEPLPEPGAAAPPPRRSRAEKEANAESRLADLKRRMGK
ncbi:MAG: hypothetical protein IPP90_00190 [Gemmatimonadaceae bacterium]|nr:hypothetical protein [Gemmatimonadaceae bacterium]